MHRRCQGDGCPSDVSTLKKSSSAIAVMLNVRWMSRFSLIFRDVEFATLEWVAWFNTCRLLAPLGYLPPAEYEAQFDQLGTAPAMAGVLN